VNEGKPANLAPRPPTEGPEARLRIHRRLNFWRDRLVRYWIWIDSSKVGQIGWGETRDIAVTPGRHEVKVTIQRFWSSEVLPVVVEAGEVLALECGPGITTIVTLSVLRNRYLQVTLAPVASN
jgi:hypothetical protein